MWFLPVPVLPEMCATKGLVGLGSMKNEPTCCTMIWKNMMSETTVSFLNYTFSIYKYNKQNYHNYNYLGCFRFWFLKMANLQKRFNLITTLCAICWPNKLSSIILVSPAWSLSIHFHPVVSQHSNLERDVQRFASDTENMNITRFERNCLKVMNS